MALVKYKPTPTWSDYAYALAKDPRVQGYVSKYGQKALQYGYGKFKDYWNSGSKKASAAASRASATGIYASRMTKRIQRGSRRKTKKRGRGSSVKSKAKLARDIWTYIQSPQRYLNTYSSTATAISGTQIVKEFAFMNYDDLLDVYTNSLGPITGSVPLSKLMFEKSYGRVELTNSSSQPLIGCVYIVKSRRDTDGSAVGIWQTSQHTVPGSPYSSINDYGATPYMAPEFTARFKVVSQFGFHLNTGEQREWSFKMHNGQFNYANLTEGIYSYRDWTTSIIVVAWGSTVHSNTGDVSTAPIRLDFVVNEFYNYRNVVVSTPYIHTSGGLPLLDTGHSYLNTGVSAQATAL